MNVQQGNSMTDEMQSENINELAEALAKAQGVIEGAAKDSANPFFKSKYADLHSVKEACREPLSQNGLAVVQTTNLLNGQLVLITVLMHKSGQWIKGIMPIVSVKQDPQGIGSAITYFRRYSYSAMIGVSQFDDDGESAMDRTKPEIAAAKEYKVGDLIDKILSVKRVIPDEVALKKYLKEKADAHNKTSAEIIASAMKSEAQFEAFYNAFIASVS